MTDMTFKTFVVGESPLNDITAVFDWDVILGHKDEPHVIFEAQGYNHTWTDAPHCYYAAPRARTVIEVPEIGPKKIVKLEQAFPWMRRNWKMWGVETSFSSYLKTKWDEATWRSNLCAYVTRNKKRLIRVYSDHVAQACANALAVIPKLQDLPINLWDFEWEKKAIGREIRVDGAYARIERIDTEARFNDQLFVVPTRAETFPPPPGWDVDGDDICNPEHWRDDYARGYWTELLNPAINWFVSGATA